jgi:hypothetical protein
VWEGVLSSSVITIKVFADPRPSFLVLQP